MDCDDGASTTEFGHVDMVLDVDSEARAVATLASLSTPPLTAPGAPRAGRSAQAREQPASWPDGLAASSTPIHAGAARPARAGRCLADDMRFKELGPVLNPKASAEDYFSHERVDPALSGLGPSDLEMVRNIYVHFAYEKTKMAHIFPGDPVYGPWYGTRKIRCVQPDNPKQHLENLLVGLTQLSKSQETVFAAWACFFVLGIVPVIFVRNAGGRSVGSEDMAKAVNDFNTEILDYLKSLDLADADIAKFLLTPKVASNRENLVFTQGRHSLAPQVLIMCMNPTSIEKLKTKKAADQLMTPMALLSGGKDSPFLMKNARPHEPTDNGKNRPRTRMAILADEDDLTRSVSNKGATQSMNWSQKDKSVFDKAFMDELYSMYAVNITDSDSDTDSVDGVEDVDRDEDQLKWLTSMTALRTSFFLTVSITATPAALLPDQDVDGIVYNVIQLDPPMTYIGYPISKEYFPHLERTIEVVECTDRKIKQRVLKTELYKRLLQTHCAVDGVPLWDDETQTPTLPGISVNKKGILSITKKAAADDPVLDWLRTIAEEAVRAKFGVDDIEPAWAADGDNITRMLQSMEHDRIDVDCGPEGAYRNALIITNHTMHQGQQSTMCKRLLAMSRDQLCSDISGLIVIEYFHKHIKVSWNIEEHDTDELLACLRAGTAKGNTNLWKGSGDKRGGKQGENTSQAPGVYTFKSKLSNINHAYSCLWRYHDKQKDIRAQWKLKMVSLTGAIGGRGVRYKGADHEFVLTDMYFAFVVRSDRAPSMHGELAIQTVGRLCTVVRDLSITPKIRLWTPRNCARVLCQLFMPMQYQLVRVAACRRASETFEAALDRLLDKEDASVIRQAYLNCFSKTGAGKSRHHLSNSRLKKKEEKMRQSVVAGRAAETNMYYKEDVGLDYDPAEHRPAAMDDLVYRATKKVWHSTILAEFATFVGRGLHVHDAAASMPEAGPAVPNPCPIVDDRTTPITLPVAVRRFLEACRDELFTKFNHGEREDATTGAILADDSPDRPENLTVPTLCSIFQERVEQDFEAIQTDDTFLFRRNVGDSLLPVYVDVRGLDGELANATVQRTQSSPVVASAAATKTSQRKRKAKEQPIQAEPVQPKKSRAQSKNAKGKRPARPRPNYVRDAEIDSGRHDRSVGRLRDEWTPGPDDMSEDDEM